MQVKARAEGLAAVVKTHGSSGKVSSALVNIQYVHISTIALCTEARMTCLLKHLLIVQLHHYGLHRAWLHRAGCRQARADKLPGCASVHATLQLQVGQQANGRAVAFASQHLQSKPPGRSWHIRLIHSGEVTHSALDVRAALATYPKPEVHTALHVSPTLEVASVPTRLRKALRRRTGWAAQKRVCKRRRQLLPSLRCSAAVAVLPCRRLTLATRMVWLCVSALACSKVLQHSYCPLWVAGKQLLPGWQHCSHRPGRGHKLLHQQDMLGRRGLAHRPLSNLSQHAGTIPGTADR